MVIVAYRQRGQVFWSHHFRVSAKDWHSFYRHCRVCRQSSEYSYVRNGECWSVL